MTRTHLAAAVPLCTRCGFVRAVKGTLCAHCDALTAYIRELAEQGLTMRDVSVLLGLHERAVAAPCASVATRRPSGTSTRGVRGMCSMWSGRLRA